MKPKDHHRQQPQQQYFVCIWPLFWWQHFFQNYPYISHVFRFLNYCSSVLFRTAHIFCSVNTPMKLRFTVLFYFYFITLKKTLNLINFYFIYIYKIWSKINIYFRYYFCFTFLFYSKFIFFFQLKHVFSELPMHFSSF